MERKIHCSFVKSLSKVSCVCSQCFTVLAYKQLIHSWALDSSRHTHFPCHVEYAYFKHIWIISVVKLFELFYGRTKVPHQKLISFENLLRKGRPNSQLQSFEWSVVRLQDQKIEQIRFDIKFALIQGNIHSSVGWPFRFDRRQKYEEYWTI